MGKEQKVPEARHILGFGQAQFVIPHLLRDLKDKIRSRNKSGMTVVNCHAELCKANQRGTSCVSLHPSAKPLGVSGSCSHDDVTQPRPRISKFAKLTKKFNPAVVWDKAVSEAHRKELNVLTSYRLNDFKKKAAFTLAEVLITLGIIGVVAAMTIPTISHNIQEMVLNNQFKKFYSTFKQAFIGVQTMEGRPIRCFYWDENPYAGKCTSKCDTNEFNEFVNCRCEETGEAPPSDYMGLRSECTMLFNEVITNRLKVAKICKDHALEGGCLPEDIRGKDKIREELNPDGNYNPEGEFSDSKIKNVYPVVVLQDGTYIISYGTKSYASPIYAFDINGKKGPNKWGYDIYGVSFYGNSKNGITEFRNYVLAEKGGKYLEQRLEALGIK